MNDILLSILKENISLGITLVFLLFAAAAGIGTSLGLNVEGYRTENGLEYRTSPKAIFPIICVIAFIAFLMGWSIYERAVIPVHRNGTYTVHDKLNYRETYSFVIKDEDGEYYKFSDIAANTYYDIEEGCTLECSFTEKKYLFNKKKLPECKDLEIYSTFPNSDL